MHEDPTHFMPHLCMHRTMLLQCSWEMACAPCVWALPLMLVIPCVDPTPKQPQPCSRARQARQWIAPPSSCYMRAHSTKHPLLFSGEQRGILYPFPTCARHSRRWFERWNCIKWDLCVREIDDENYTAAITVDQINAGREIEKKIDIKIIFKRGWKWEEKEKKIRPNSVKRKALLGKKITFEEFVKKNWESGQSSRPPNPSLYMYIYSLGFGYFT